MKKPQQKFIREFTPNWFAVIMGNGGVALVLHHFSGILPWLHTLGALIWWLDIALFILFSGLFVARFIFYPSHFILLLKNATQPLFLGCIPMALATIVNGFIAFGAPTFGVASAYQIAIIVWWCAVGLALITAWLIPAAMFLLQKHTLETMTPMWLLPIVACEVASASGGLLLDHFPIAWQATILFFCFILWSISVMLAMAIITIFVHRLIVHSLPAQNFAPSIWLVLGPIGTGVLGLITLSQGTLLIEPNVTPHLQALIVAFPDIGLFVAIIMWGFGFWWLITALISTIFQFVKGIKFAMSWWAFTFPLAVFTLGTLALANETSLLLFAIPGVCVTLLLLFFWIAVIIKTFQGALNQSLFYAPCIHENKNN